MSGRNVAASVRARLLNRARETRQDFNLILTRYVLERLLYRLSISRHADQFLLKGALLFDLWFDIPHRPTRDADFLGFGSAELPHLEAIFKDVCAHSFSFPLRYFEVHRPQPDWPIFLDDFQQHWPNDKKNCYVDFVRDGLTGDDEARSGSTRWRRITEERAGAKSVFHFDVPGSVAKSTHAGLPWLRYLRNQVSERVHFWPFDGWEIPAGKSALVDVYPSLWSKRYPREGRTPDQHDAYVAAAWLRQVDADGSLGKFLKPSMLPGEYHVARVEGWILGVM